MRIGDTVTNPGELATPVTLLGATVLTQDAAGAQKPVRTSLGTRYVRWRNVHGNELAAGWALGALKPATVLMRWETGLAEDCALEKGGEVYEIVSMDDIYERHEYVELKVKLWRGSV